MASQYGVSVGVNIPPGFGTHCRTACVERNHISLGECLRAANLHTNQVDTSSQKAWDSELSAYQNARRQGIQPAGTTMRQVRQALDESDRTGRPYGIGV